MNYSFTRVAVVVSCLCLTALDANAGELGLAFWNVENLFDTVDDPKTEGDEEFTPGEPKAWTKTHCSSLISMKSMSTRCLLLKIIKIQMR